MNKRQNEILKELKNASGNYVKTSELASILNIGIRTIQNDINSIRIEITGYSDYFVIESQTRFGVRLIVKDENEFNKFLIVQDTNDDILAYRGGRINRIFQFLINQKKAISLDKCADYVYVSKTTILQDLSLLESIISKYSLKLIKSKGYVWIDGLERDKRMCIIDIDDEQFRITPADSIMNNDLDQSIFISKTFLDETIKEQYQIADVDFQNLVIWTNVSIKRIKNYFFINDDDINDVKVLDKEYNIAANVFKKIESKYNVRVPKLEILYLATYISNHFALDNSKYISPEINSFISDALSEIDKVFPLKTIEDMDLRIALAMHCAPMISRTKNNMPAKNKMISYVKQQFQYAYDVATFFAYQLQKKFECKLNEDEISFLAIYFNKNINDAINKKGKKRICIITALKKSSYYLLEQVLYNYFKNTISSITFITPSEIEEEEDLEKYDIFFSTEESRAVELGLAAKISCFPDDNDIKYMRYIIEGSENIDNILRYFDPDLFFVESTSNKDRIQDKLVLTAESKYNISDLSKEIELREEFGSTYFGNGVAILHPMHYRGDVSFFGAAILEDPIYWDNAKNKASIVFIVCLQKSDPISFRVWDYISKVIFDNEFKKKITKVKDFEDFKNLFINLYHYLNQNKIY